MPNGNVAFLVVSALHSFGKMLTAHIMLTMPSQGKS